jgi:peptide deformylase
MSDPTLKEFTYNTAEPPTIIQKKYDPLPLYNDKNPMLSQHQEPMDLSRLPADLIETCNRLLATMNHYGGVGLAAPQCGLPWRLFVAAGGMVCINPKIITASIETTREKEGCLSFPGLYLPITRSRTIEVEYHNEFGVLKHETFTGATAKIFQHETDHLNGIVFTSLVGNLTLQMAKKKKQKMFKRMERIVEIKEMQRKMTTLLSKNTGTKAVPVSPRAVEVQSNRVK